RDGRGSRYRYNLTGLALSSRHGASHQLRMLSKSSFFLYSSRALYLPLMTYSISGSQHTMLHLLGWHWEFLPSFLAKLAPGVDLVPFWTMAVANVYRKSKRVAVAAEESRAHHCALRDPQHS